MLDIMVPSFVTIEGRRIAYAEASPPQPRGTILLLAGLSNDRLGWYRQLPIFGQEYRTIALDHRDTGASDPADGPYRIADLADDAAAALRALGIHRSHIIGISMGGFVALELALRHADLVDRLVLVSTSPRSIIYSMLSPRVLAAVFVDRKLEPGEQMRRSLSLLMEPGFAESHPDEMERIAEVGRCGQVTKEAYNRQLRACLRHDVSRRLGDIQTPTLVIHGEDDPALVVKNALTLARRIPAARLVVYPKTGHITIIERAEEFNRDVLDFLGQSSPA
jgi:pimeloyl-ACP methyl ester carboxylesterase